LTNLDADALRCVVPGEVGSVRYRTVGKDMFELSTDDLFARRSLFAASLGRLLTHLGTMWQVKPRQLQG
jgi:hypothetical protein